MNKESRLRAFQVDYDNRSDDEREKIIDEAIEALKDMVRALDAIIDLHKEKENNIKK